MKKKINTGAAVKKFCLWCCFGSVLEIKECPVRGCSLYRYRIGRKRVPIKAILRKCKDCYEHTRKFEWRCEDQLCPLAPWGGKKKKVKRGK